MTKESTARASSTQLAEVPTWLCSKLNDVQLRGDGSSCNRLRGKRDEGRVHIISWNLRPQHAMIEHCGLDKGAADMKEAAKR